MTQPTGPVLIELDDAAPVPRVEDAAPVPDLGHPPPTGQAMSTVAALSGHGGSRMARWFWTLAVASIGAWVSVAAWNALWAIIAAQPVAGYILATLTGGFVAVALIIAVKEAAVFARLARIDRLQRDARTAAADASLADARKVVDDMVRLYSGRSDMTWGRDRLKERKDEVFDAAALFELTEAELLAPLDKAAAAEVATAGRQVATVTALVPLALADVVAALVTNLRMVRRIGEIYGGRSGTLGSWRLTRAVLAHLVATGALSVGDDFLEPLVGSSIMGKISRRFGEGLVNGALTVRVGVAAMNVCRPLDFSQSRKPSGKVIGRTALSGLFSKATG